MAVKTALQQITTIAKQLRKAKPAKSWRDCITEASKQYKRKSKGKTVGSIKKKAPAKKKAPVKKKAAAKQEHLVHTKSVKTFELAKVGSVNFSKSPVYAMEGIAREIKRRNEALQGVKQCRQYLSIKLKNRTPEMRAKMAEAKRNWIQCKKIVTATTKHIAQLKKLL